MLRNTAWITVAFMSLGLTGGCHCGRMGYYGYPYGAAYAPWNGYALTGYSQQAGGTVAAAPFQCQCEPLNSGTLAPQPDRGPHGAPATGSNPRQPASQPRPGQTQFQQTSLPARMQQAPTAGWRVASNAVASPGHSAEYRTAGDAAAATSGGPVLTGYVGQQHGPHGPGCSCAVPGPQPTPPPSRPECAVPSTPECAVPPASSCGGCGAPGPSCASCGAPEIVESCSGCGSPHVSGCASCGGAVVESCAGCGAPGEIIEGEIVPGCSGCGGAGCSGCGGTIEASPTCSICGGSHAAFSGTIETFQPSGPVSPAPPAEADKPSEARPDGPPKRQYEPDTDIPQPPTARQMQWVPRQSL